MKSNILKDNIIYEDKKIIVFNKPVNLAVQGGNKVKISVDDLLEDFRDEWGEKPRLTHRIDKDTSGLLIVAKKAKVAARITKLFQENKIHKTYVALTAGRPKEMQGVINKAIAQSRSKSGKEIVAVSNAKYAKKALTEYQVIDYAGNNICFIATHPVTGRKHQIRVHLSAIGCPILGDGRYGGKDAFNDNLSNKIHLHAYRIHIPDYYEKTLNLQAPLSPHMQESFDKLGFNIKDLR